MKVIYKYPLKIQEFQLVPLPDGAEILSIQEQDGKLMLWAIVENENEKSYLALNIYGTGQKIKEGKLLKYISTAQLDSFVWHIFIEM